MRVKRGSESEIERERERVRERERERWRVIKKEKRKDGKLLKVTSFKRKMRAVKM